MRIGRNSLKHIAGACVLLFAGTVAASDNHNLCRNAPGAPSANVALPRDDTFHYTTAPVNLQSGSNGFESDFKAWHWLAAVNGVPTRFDGYRFMFAIFAGPSVGWLKLSILNLVGPDGQHQFIKVEPGQFAEPSNAYDLSIGDWHATGSGGVEQEALLSDDGGFGVDVQDSSLKNPSYPMFDGFGDYISPTTGQSLGKTYYWARPLLASFGSITYNGARYFVLGSAWQDRQWLGQNGVQWNWASIQLDDGDTLAAYDIIEKSSGLPVIHSLNIVGEPPSCEATFLSHPSDWQLQATGSWVSPVSGVSFATHFRLLVPSRHIDLSIVPVTLNQEVVTAIGSFPGGAWEGAASVEGTIDGRHVHGTAYVEQFNK